MWCFKGLEKGCIGFKWIKHVSVVIYPILQFHGECVSELTVELFVAIWKVYIFHLFGLWIVKAVSPSQTNVFHSKPCAKHFLKCITFLLVMLFLKISRKLNKWPENRFWFCRITLFKYTLKAEFLNTISIHSYNTKYMFTILEKWIRYWK